MTSNPHYGAETTGTEVAKIFSNEIKGKTILITGISPNSLGETLAVTVAAHAPTHLILASRTPSKLFAVRQKLPNTLSTRITLLPINLASQTSIREAAKKIKPLAPHIDVLINNAGVVSSTRQETEDGIELTFGTNHIGHFLLTSLLLPNITRVVNVSSLGYKLSPFRFHDYNFEGKAVPEEELPPKGLPRSFTPGKGREYVTFCAYGQSKTANVLHVVGLRRRGVGAFAVHPGTIWTDLPRSLSERDYKIIEGSSGWKNHDQGIATTLVAAFDPMLKDGGDGIFLSDCQFEGVLPYAKDPELAERLWKLSESLVGGQAKL